MISVNFYLRNLGSKGKANIHLFLSYGKKYQFIFPTGRSIKPEEWSKDKKQAREGKNYPDGKALNFDLKELKDIVEAVYYKLGVNANKDSLKIEILKVLEGEPETPEVNLIQLFITHREKNPTLKVFKMMGPHLVAFQKTFGKLTLDRIDYDFEKAYTKYMEKESFSVNYMGRHIKNIKTVLNAAIREGLDSPLHFRNFKVPREDVYNIYLSEDELRKLYELKFSKKEKHIEAARDRFLVGCYTGLRFNDFSRFNPEKHIIDGNKIRIVTGNEIGSKSREVVIPIHPIVREIMNKYGNNLPPSLPNQKLNARLKTLGEDAKIKQMITKWQTKGGVRKEISTEKYNLITTHTARRSFATNAFLAGIPEKLIMDITGHTTTKAFHTYIKITREQGANLLLEHPFFNLKLNY